MSLWFVVLMRSCYCVFVLSAISAMIKSNTLARHCTIDHRYARETRLAIRGSNNTFCNCKILISVDVDGLLTLY